LAEEFNMPYLGAIPLSEKIFALNERSEIAFTDPDIAPLAEELLDAIEGEEKTVL
jgi:hypothetical protein